MPKLEKNFEWTIFKPEAIQKALELLDKFNVPQPNLAKIRPQDLNSLSRDNCTWHYDTLSEFFSEYRKGFTYSSLKRIYGSGCVEVTTWATQYRNLATVIVEAKKREEVDIIFEVFDRVAEASKVPRPVQPTVKPVVFIGHGRSPQWRDLKDHLHEHHGYDVQAYEVGARAGHTIRDILNAMLDGSTFAVLVMTAEDEDANGDMHPRMNVVHELGLFQGRLGFSRAVVLLEEGAAEFSNIHGIHQLRYKKGNIKETYGDVLATLRREFGKAV